jgi:hypothetical protein
VTELSRRDALRLGGLATTAAAAAASPAAAAPAPPGTPLPTRRVPAQAQPPAASGGPFRARIAGLRLGANLERWYPVAKDNRPRRPGPGWWGRFRAAGGFDHTRMFLPPARETGGGTEILGLWLQAAQDANAAGLPVLLGLWDSFHHSKPWGEEEWRALAVRAAFFGGRTDPDRVVLAPLNEPAFPDTASWVPVRDRLLAELRRAAPRHTLMWGGREWCSARSLAEAPPPTDRNTIAEVHDYQGGDADSVRARFAPLAAWRDRQGGMPVLVSELGGAEAHKTDPAAGAADLRRSLPVLRGLRLPAALWAYTHGGWWRLQSGDEPVPRPEFRAALGSA